MLPPHLTHVMRGGRSDTAPSVARRASWLVFWLFALSFGLAMFAPFIYADTGSGTCAAEDEEAGAVAVVGSAYTLAGSGDSWVDMKLMSSDDGGTSYVFFGDASEISEGAVDPGTTHLALWCGATSGSYSWELVSIPDAGGVPCSPDCTTTDVVTGLALLSDQLHATAAFGFLVIALLFTWLGAVSVLGFLSWRHGRG